MTAPLARLFGAGLVALLALPTPLHQAAWGDSSAINAAGRPIASPTRVHETLGIGDEFMGIRLLGALEMERTRIDDIPLAELSGLAYDPDDDILYAVSDEGGLFALRARFENRVLTGLDALSATRLRDGGGLPLDGASSDAEGLEWLPTERGLLISFERNHRIIEYRTDGRPVGRRAPPSGYSATNGVFRAPNLGLEALTLHQGQVLTGSESPRRRDDDDSYMISRADGTLFRLPRRDPEAGGLTALQALRDGRILAVERNFRSLWTPVVIRLYLFGPEPSSPVRLIAELDNGKGWNIDNFEGLAVLPDGRLLMVSDDNGSGLQRTILLCFELIEASQDDPVQSPK